MTNKDDTSIKSRIKVEKKYDDKEDINIKNIASYKESNYSKIIFCILIIILGFSSANLLISINSYKNSKENYVNNENIIEIKRYKDNILITNDGNINEIINNKSYDKDNTYKIEKIISIQLKSDKNGEDSKVLYNLKYNIFKNDFPKNVISKNESDVLVKFSYSYDKKEWVTINNVLSTTESTINPLMGKLYDISGIKDNLKILTNATLEAEDGSSNIIYWKSETIFKKQNNNDQSNTFNASFKIEYVEN